MSDMEEDMQNYIVDAIANSFSETNGNTDKFSKQLFKYVKDKYQEHVWTITITGEGQSYRDMRVKLLYAVINDKIYVRIIGYLQWCQNVNVENITEGNGNGTQVNVTKHEENVI